MIHGAIDPAAPPPVDPELARAVTTAGLARRLDSLDRRLFTYQAPTWHMIGDTGEPAFETGFANAASGTNPVMFWRDAFGIVHLRGQAVSTTFGVLGMFTLPPLYRPQPSGITIPCFPYSGGAGINITSGGRVETVGALNSGVVVSLDGCHFYAIGPGEPVIIP